MTAHVKIGDLTAAHTGRIVTLGVDDQHPDDALSGTLDRVVHDHWRIVNAAPQSEITLRVYGQLVTLRRYRDEAVEIR